MIVKFIFAFFLIIIFLEFNSGNLSAQTNSITAKMITIPAGTFEMGSNDARRAEKPVHMVNIKSFQLGETEVTQQQWRELMGNNPSKFTNCKDCPVERVSWDNIQTYLKKLNRKTGYRFRLPTEAEWEYACRSAGEGENYCGSNDRDIVGWYARNSDQKTHHVKQKPANSLGLYDMSGNVFEWVQDCWNPSYDGAPSDGSAWLDGDCEQRILRGGSWNSFSAPGYLRSVFRFRHKRFNKQFHVFGFRLAHDSMISE